MIKGFILLTISGIIAGCTTLGTSLIDESIGCKSDSAILCIEINKDRSITSAALESLIMQHEGFSNTPYQDNGNLSVGYGRNLTSTGITEEEAYYLMRNDIERIESGLKKKFPVTQQLDHGRYNALVSIAYTTGLTGISEFKLMWDAIHKRQWKKAALEIYMSKWCSQVKETRCTEIATMMEEGTPYESSNS